MAASTTLLESAAPRQRHRASRPLSRWHPIVQGAKTRLVKTPAFLAAVLAGMSAAVTKKKGRLS
jgi:hypothetical protein